MNKAMLVAVLDAVKAQNVVLDNNSLLFWLNKFIETKKTFKPDDDANILKQFSSYLKKESPELYAKTYDHQEFKQLWELVCLAGEPVAIKYLIENKVIDKDTKNELDKNILHYATQSGSVDAMQTALELGIDPQSTVDRFVPNYRTHIVTLAALSGNEPAIKLAKKLLVDDTANQKPSTDDNLILSQYWFMYLVNKMGYKNDFKGLCVGVAHMAKQAVLAGEIDKFDARFKLIQQYVGDSDKLKKEIEEAHVAVKNHQPLTEHQEKVLDIQAFFEGIELYQNANQKQYDHITGSSLLRQHIAADILTPLLIPVKLEKNNGKIEKVGNISGSYSEKKLDDMINSLKRLCEKTNFPCSIVLAKGGREWGHGINLSYDNKEKCWLVIDANRLPSKKIAFDDMALLKATLLQSFAVISDKQSFKYLHASIYVHNDNTNTKKADVRQMKRGIKTEFFPKSRLSFLKDEFDKLTGTPKKSAILLGAFLGFTLATSLTLTFASLAVPGVLGVAALIGVGLYVRQRVLNTKAQIKAGNDESKSDDYLILTIDDKKKHFGRANSTSHQNNRDKFFECLKIITESKLSASSTVKNLKILHEGMHKYESAFFKADQEKALQQIFENVHKICVNTAATTAMNMKALGVNGVENCNVQTACISPQQKIALAELESKPALKIDNSQPSASADVPVATHRIR